MEGPLIQKKCSDCFWESVEMLKKVLSNEDVIFLLMIGTFLFSLALWTVAKWSKNRQEKAQKQKRIKRMQDRLRRTRNLSSILQDLSSGEEIVAKENKEEDCDEEVEEVGHFEVMGDHPDPVPPRENIPEVVPTSPPLNLTFQEFSDSAQTPQTYTLSPQSETDPTSAPITPSAEIATPSPSTPNEVQTVRKKSPVQEAQSPPKVPKTTEDSSEKSSMKSRISKYNKLRVDPLEFRYKRMKKSPQDLNVAFGSRLATPRIGDFSCDSFPKSLSNQVSPTLSMSRSSLVRSQTNLSFVLKGHPPENIPRTIPERPEPETKSPEILSTTSSEASNSIKT